MTAAVDEPQRSPSPSTPPSPAPRHLRRLLSDSAIYGLGGVASQALGILLVPIYARVLGASNYGILAVLNTTLALTTMVVTLALPQAFFRSYLSEAQSPTDRRRVLAGTLGLRLAIGVVFAALWALIAAPLTGVVVGSSERLPLMLLVGPIVFCDTLNLVPLSFLRAERRPAPYAALSFFRSVFGTVLILVLVVFAHQGVFGAMLGSALSALITTAIGVAVLARYRAAKPGFDSGLWRHMLVFSLPLVPAAIAGWSLGLSDRYIIGAVDGFRAVGIYSVGYTIGLVMNALVIQPFGLAWGAAYWEFAREEGAPRIIARAMTLFVIAASVPALGLSLFGTDVLRRLFSPEFAEGRFVVPFSAFGYLMYGLYSIAATGLNLRSQTRWLPFTVAASALVNLLLNLVFIPRLGFMAAAYSTLLSYALLAVLTGAASQRYYPVPWDYPRVLGALGLGLGLAGVGLLGPDAFLWRLACFVAFPVALLATGILSWADAYRVLGWLSRIAHRFSQRS